MDPDPAAFSMQILKNLCKKYFGFKEKTMGLVKIYFKYLNKTTIITVLISLYFSVILEFFSAIFNDLPCLRVAEDRGREAEG